MSIATLLSEFQQNPQLPKYHTFDIDEREEIQKLWKEIQMQHSLRKTITPTKKDVTIIEDVEQIPALKQGLDDMPGTGRPNGRASNNLNTQNSSTSASIDQNCSNAKSSQGQFSRSKVEMMHKLAAAYDR